MKGSNIIMEKFDIKDEEFIEKGKKTVIYFCTLNNSMEIVGYGCDRDKEIAKQKAKRRAKYEIEYFKDKFDKTDGSDAR